MEIDVVLSGSSTKYPAHIGFFEAILDPERDLQIARIAANSGGSIIAGAIAAGVDVESLKKCTMETNVKNFANIDSIWAKWRTKKYGYANDGRKFQKFLRNLTFNKKLGELNIPISIMASNYTHRCLEIFSTNTHPDMELWKAIYASSCMPLLFKGFHYNGCSFRDGAIYKDFPWDIWPEEDKPRIGHLIGFHSMFSDNPDDDEWDMWDELNAYSTNVIHHNIKTSIENGPTGHHVIVESSGLGLGAFDLDVKKSHKRALIREGFRNTSRELDVLMERIRMNYHNNQT